MSNETQHNSAIRQARSMSKVRNIVIGALAGLACLVTLVGCGDSLEDKAKPIVEEAYKRFSGDYIYECQKIANLEEIGPGRYRGTALMKAVNYSKKGFWKMDNFRKSVQSYPHKPEDGTAAKLYYEEAEGGLKRMEAEHAKFQRGEGPVKSRAVYIEDLGDYMTVEFE
ncbi:MAG: hypothetical protein IKW49_02790 [Opitutales bacterium]|nr:hypothetical protein [Opitutales bacterium]